jgi:hypothetical protein
MGNQVFRDAFPGVAFIAHQRTREYLPAAGLTNRQQAILASGYPQFIVPARHAEEKSKAVWRSSE